MPFQYDRDGANPAATRHDLYRKSGLSTKLFERVDVGYVALDTSGNADETKAWATAHGFSRLIIVTSSYHMPRSLTEFGRAMPDVILVPSAVLPRKSKYWWADISKARVIFSEYVKFLPSATRYAVARLTAWNDSAVAGSAKRGPPFGCDDRAPLARLRGGLLPQHGGISRRWQLATVRSAPLGHGRAASARPRQPVVAQGDLRHASRGARAREAAEGRLPGRCQASVGLGYVRPHPGVSRSSHGHEGGAWLDSAQAGSATSSGTSSSSATGDPAPSRP
jgi:hypothetical protein